MQYAPNRQESYGIVRPEVNGVSLSSFSLALTVLTLPLNASLIQFDGFFRSDPIPITGFGMTTAESGDGATIDSMTFSGSNSEGDSIFVGTARSFACNAFITGSGRCSLFNLTGEVDGYSFSFGDLYINPTLITLGGFPNHSPIEIDVPLVAVFEFGPATTFCNVQPHDCFFEQLFSIAPMPGPPPGPIPEPSTMALPVVGVLCFLKTRQTCRSRAASLTPAPGSGT